MATPRCCMLTECRRFRLTARLRLFLVLLRSETCIGCAVWFALFVVLPVTVAAGYASFLLCKSAESWKPLWIRAALDAGVPVGRSVGTLFTTRNLMLIAQPFILGALLGASEGLAVIVIGVFCLVCAGLFYLMTRGTVLTENETERSAEDLA